LLVEFNLADIFESVADAIGDREALICGERRLTYAQLDERANRIAHHLAEAGIRPGDHVGFYLYNSTEYVEALIACLKIRAVPINVNYRYVEGELKYLFDDADLVGLVHQREFAPRIAKVAGPKLRTFLMVDDASQAGAEGLPVVAYDEALASGGAQRDFEPRSGDDLFIIYTGGTTGMPKGVMWRQEDLFFTGMGGGNPMGVPVEKPEEVAENATQRMQVVQFAVPPLIHGAAQLGVFIGLNWGDKVVLVPKFDPDLVWDTVVEEGVNTITIVGDAMARPLAEAFAKKPRDVPTLVYFGSAGAVLSESVKQQLRELLPNTIVAENFGATETGHQGTQVPGTPPPDGGGLRFIMNDRTTVFDDDFNRLEPGSGRIGKLALKGRIPLGYYKDEAKTKATFVEAEGERWVMPGDLATVDADGTIIVFGRGAVCINSGGEKVFPEEVEQAVRAHPDVYDAIVVGAPDERWGERVVAVVQPREGRTLTLDDLVAHCRTLVAGYKVPRELRIVEQVQRQPSGKPDFTWAKALVREPAT
jgi:acyl-CoA synthetase (AMP-forming)/AMP-acid ligase II